jgi:hypothetical protein
MVAPDSVPVNVATPTAPKLSVVPVTRPLMCRLRRGDDSVNGPSSALPVWRPPRLLAALSDAAALSDQTS